MFWLHPKRVEFSRNQISEERYKNQIDDLYSMYLSIVERGEDLESYIRDLPEMSLSEREAMSKDDSEYGCIAELSLYLSAVSIVRTFSYVKAVDFWTLWNEWATNKMYQDVIEKEKPSRKKERDRPVYHYYEAIYRKSEDAFLGEWENRDLYLSNEMKRAIEDWKESYVNLAVPDAYDMEKEMAEILSDLTTDWDIRYADERFVSDFLEKKQDENYQKGLMLLKTITDRYVDLFPELTRRQALDWVIKRSRSDFDSVEVSGLLGVLSNKEVRKDIFGF